MSLLQFFVLESISATVCRCLIFALVLYRKRNVPGTVCMFYGPGFSCAIQPDNAVTKKERKTAS